MSNPHASAEAAKAEKVLANEILEVGQKRVEAMMEAQKQLTTCCEQLARSWADRMKVELDLASDLTTKLGSAKSFPDSVRVYQEWLGRRLKLFAEEGQELLGDTQMLLNASTRAVSGSHNTGSHNKRQ